MHSLTPQHVTGNALAAGFRYTIQHQKYMDTAGGDIEKNILVILHTI
jgi:hypothetical protein